MIFYQVRDIKLGTIWGKSKFKWRFSGRFYVTPTGLQEKRDDVCYNHDVPTALFKTIN